MTDEATLRARYLLRTEMIDPLWMSALDCGAYEIDDDDRATEQILRAARTRARGFLADRLDFAYADCDVAKFDLATCRRAWTILRGVGYAEIRDWYKLMRPKKGKADGEAKATTRAQRRGETAHR